MRARAKTYIPISSGIRPRLRLPRVIIRIVLSTDFQYITCLRALSYEDILSRVSIVNVTTRNTMRNMDRVETRTRSRDQDSTMDNLGERYRSPHETFQRCVSHRRSFRELISLYRRRLVTFRHDICLRYLTSYARSTRCTRSHTRELIHRRQRLQVGLQDMNVRPSSENQRTG